jgi:Flp pilus assembly pilin Flp
MNTLMRATVQRRSGRQIAMAVQRGALRGTGTRSRSARLRLLLNDENGAATAEYAIATMAAVAFAGMLVAIMRSDEVRGILTDLVHRALSVP